VLLALLWGVAFLNSADRSILTTVLPQLRDEFGLSGTQLALLGSVFFWIYAVAAFVFGRIGDGARRSRVILYGLVFWSIATGLTALSTGFAMILAFRGLVALGEASYYPTATALIGDWHRPAMRSRALSLHQTAVFAGAGLGALFAGLLADRIGWHAPFVIFGAIGIVHAVVLARFLRDAPTRTITLNRVKADEPVRVVLRNRPAMMLCVVFFLGTGASTGLNFWAPTYVHDALGLNLAASALWGAATINIAGFLSVPLGGLLADTLAKRNPLGRFYTLAIGLGAAAVLLLPLLWATSAPMVGAVLIATSVGKGLFDGCIYAAMQDVMPPHARATAVGMMTMIGFFGAGISPLFVALVGESLGLAAAMTALSVAYLLAVVIILLMRRSIRAAVLANEEAASA
jgi:MFS family permease